LLAQARMLRLDAVRIHRARAALVGRAGQLCADCRAVRQASIVLRSTTRRLRHERLRRQFERLSSNPKAFPPAVGRVAEILHAQRERRLTLVEIGALLGRSPWHLNVTFQRHTGLTVYEYANAVRMTEAAAVIRGGMKVEAAALSLGYSRTTFYRQFEAFYGVSPASYRESASAAVPGGPPLRESTWSQVTSGLSD
jgi:AraC-like DNA-binding protein